MQESLKTQSYRVQYKTNDLQRRLNRAPWDRIDAEKVDHGIYHIVDVTASSLNDSVFVYTWEFEKDLNQKEP
jgi:hypothetical protein